MSLLFYDDSPVFGGHEVMTLAGLDAVLRASSEPTVFLAAAANTKLLERLHQLAATHPHLTVESLPWHSSKLEAARNLALPNRTRTLARRFKQLTPAPTLIIAVQGNIEHSSLALRAARHAGIKCASYLPVPHTNRQMGAKLGAARDRFCTPILKLPDAWITITDEMARMLTERGATAPVHIVYNGIDTERFHPGDSTEARKSLNLPNDKTLLGIVGRIEFTQKQQHLLVEAVASSPTLRHACHLVFAGDGPDSPALENLLASHAIPASPLPWCDTAPLYQALDALVIPSRYEGLPLVMLEALATGTSVFGSDRDGMIDLLPPERRFNPDHPESLATILSQWITNGQPGPSPDLVTRVRETMSLSAFGRSFSSTILQIAR